MLVLSCGVQFHRNQSKNRKASQGKGKACTCGCVTELISGSQVSAVAQFHKTSSRRQYEMTASWNSLLGERRIEEFILLSSRSIQFLSLIDQFAQWALNPPAVLGCVSSSLQASAGEDRSPDSAAFTVKTTACRQAQGTAALLPLQPHRLG